MESTPAARNTPACELHHGTITILENQVFYVEMTQFTTLINAAELAELKQSRPNNVKILDCRGRLGEADYGVQAYSAGHIPTASYLSLDADLAAAAGAAGRHPLPDAAKLAARLAGLGVNAADQIVVYDDAGGAFAARAWWCVRWLGHSAVALLDGGMSAWSGDLSTAAADGAAANSAAAKAKPGNFQRRASLTRTVDAASLVASIGGHAAAGGNAYTLIDARTQARFDGVEEPIDAVAGHIPGAHCLPFQENLDAAGAFRTPAELHERFAVCAAGSADVVSYCGSGVTAAHNILAMIVAGYPEPILYPGSWSEWIIDPARPRSPD